MSDQESNSTFERMHLMVAAVVLGGLVGALGNPVFDYLANGARATTQLVQESFATRPFILMPLAYEGEGLVTNVENKVQPGHTLIQGIMPGGAQIRMVDKDGKEVHRWKADFFKFWPDADKVFPDHARPKSELNYFIQGMWPMRDGSIILNFGQLGTVRLDQCSNLIWRSDRQTHHSVTLTADGNYWIPGVIAVSDTPADYLPRDVSPEDLLKSSGDSLSKSYNNSALLVSPDGKVLKEFSLVKAVYDAGLEHAIYASLQEEPADPIHLNDIEVVTPELAAKIEGVNAGDLLVSIREMNMLAIIDQNDGSLKWHQQGPFLRQHDPDITPDGMIDIFNNRSEQIGPNVKGSQIVRLDPATRKTTVLYPVGEADNFYSPIMGTHQTLDNGNQLIAESTYGRLFEVTPQGEVVWDYRLPYDDKVASLFSAALRIPDDYFDNGVPQCSQ